MTPYLIAVEVLIGGAAILVMFGLWTPLAGALAAILEAGSVIPLSCHTGEAMLAAATAVSLAMLGPGSYSVDARSYGRKTISLDSL